MATATRPTFSLKYLDTIGFAAQQGRGYQLPVALAVRSDGRIYVISRCGYVESSGIRVGIVESAGEEQRIQDLDTFARIYAPTVGSSVVMDYLGKTGLDALRGADVLKTAPQKYSSSVEYPSSSIAQSLRGVAQVHLADLGTRVFYTQHGTFDTHTDEVATQERLWREISEALEVFYADLREHGRGEEVVVFMFSEFGRRVKDNGTGTDHGSGGVSFLIGDRVKGGHYNDYPSLDSDKLVEGDLAFNFDFRGLYSDILEDWLNVEARSIVGGRFEKLTPFAA